MTEFSEGDRVMVVEAKPGGYSKDYWSRYAGLPGVVDHRSKHPRVAFPVLVLLDDGRKIWFSDKELQMETT